MSIRSPLAVVTLALVAAAAMAQSQSYPSRQIRMITPFAPGATTDVLSRTICAKFTEAWGQPCLTDNRPGATGMIGADLAAKAPPDGYTLVNVISSHVVHPSLMKKVPFHPINDFTPIILVAQVTNILIVHPSVPARNLKEFIAFARPRGTDLVYASAGNGSSNHLSAEMLKRATNIRMTHIPYKGGAPAVADLIGGQVPVMMASFLTGQPHVRAGKARGIVVTSAQRQQRLPDVPTMIESGYPGFEANEWWAILAPANTPQDIVNKLNAEIHRLMNLPDVRERITALGIDYIGGSPADLGVFLRREMDKWSKVVREAGITPE